MNVLAYHFSPSHFNSRVKAIRVETWYNWNILQINTSWHGLEPSLLLPYFWKKPKTFKFLQTWTSLVKTKLLEEDICYDSEIIYLPLAILWQLKLIYIINVFRFLPFLLVCSLHQFIRQVRQLVPDRYCSPDTPCLWAVCDWSVYVTVSNGRCEFIPSMWVSFTRIVQSVTRIWFNSTI